MVFPKASPITKKTEFRALKRIHISPYITHWLDFLSLNRPSMNPKQLHNVTLFVVSIVCYKILYIRGNLPCLVIVTLSYEIFHISTNFMVLIDSHFYSFAVPAKLYANVGDFCLFRQHREQLFSCDRSRDLLVELWDYWGLEKNWKEEPHAPISTFCYIGVFDTNVRLSYIGKKS